MCLGCGGVGGVCGVSAVGVEWLGVGPGRSSTCHPVGPPGRLVPKNINQVHH